MFCHVVDRPERRICFQGKARTLGIGDLFRKIQRAVLVILATAAFCRASRLARHCIVQYRISMVIEIGSLKMILMALFCLPQASNLFSSSSRREKANLKEAWKRGVLPPPSFSLSFFHTSFCRPFSKISRPHKKYFSTTIFCIVFIIFASVSNLTLSMHPTKTPTLILQEAFHMIR